MSLRKKERRKSGRTTLYKLENHNMTSIEIERSYDTLSIACYASSLLQP